MKTLNFLTIILSLSTSILSNASIKTSQNFVINNEPTFSDAKDYDYVCYNVTKPEALIFKTSAPQKIWKTSLNKEGQLKLKKAFQLNQIYVNSENINKLGQVASFKASLAKNYEIKGLFEKESHDELPLTVVSSYLPDGTTSQIKDHYNCEAQKNEVSLKIGTVQKTNNVE